MCGGKNKPCATCALGIGGCLTSMHEDNYCPASIEQVEDIIQYIENDINKCYISEIESKKIGEMVMDKLKDVDEVAYVRFASVYRQFKDINTFVKELKNIIMEKR